MVEYAHLPPKGCHMDVSAVTQSTQAVNQVMVAAQTKSIHQAEKLMKLSAEMSVGGAKDPNLGQVVDTSV